MLSWFTWLNSKLKKLLTSFHSHSLIVLSGYYFIWHISVFSAWWAWSCCWERSCTIIQINMLLIWWHFLQRSPWELHKRLHYTSPRGVLCRLHFHADFHDPRNRFHVIARWSPFRSLQRCSVGGVHCHCWCFFLLFSFQSDWAAPSLFSLAR